MATIPLRAPRPLKAVLRSWTKEDQFRSKVAACAAADAGQRSERDWNLVCWAVENGIDRAELWEAVSDIGKFAERGQPYFDRTLAKAEERTRERYFDQASVRVNGKASRNGEATRNGTAHTTSTGSNGDGPDEPEREGEPDDDSGRPLPEEDTDPNRLAREWLTRRARHERPGDCAAYYRQTFLCWDGRRWASVPDHEVNATVNRFIRCILEEDARLRRTSQVMGEEEEKSYTMSPVTKKLVSDVVAAIEGLILVPESVEQPS